MGIDRDIDLRLGGLWSRISSEFDLTGSKVRPGVKGGRSRKGAVRDRYVSYKDAEGRNLDLAVFQIGSTGPLECEVSLRATKASSAEPLHRRRFAYSNFEMASADFLEQLSSLGVAKR